ncbi:MAG: Ig-like domain-containing protein, partial [Pyrinomonadaceae bacterium]
MKRFAFVKMMFVLLLMTGMFAFGSTQAKASHFRGGTISWSPTGVTRQVQFRIKWFERGGTRAVGSGYSLSVNFGDGSLGTASGTVTANNAAEDWFTAEVSVIHNYPADGPYIAFVQNCCRLSPPANYANGGGLNNSSDQTIRLQTLVGLSSGNSSPTSSLPPIVTVSRSTNASFVVPASDVDRDTLRFRLATISEKGGGSNSQPPNFSVNPTTGQVTWNNFSLGTTGYWTTQIIIEDLDAAGNVKSSTPLDFMLKVQNSVGSPPTLAISPTGPLSVRPNQTATFTVTGNDADANARVTLNNGGLPAGMTSSGAPMNAALIPPVVTTFSWTPTVSQAGSYTISFTATDDTFQQALSSITIFVESNTPPQAINSSVSTNEDTATSVVLQATDVDGQNLTFSIQTNPTNGVLGPIGAPSCSVSAGTSTCTANVNYTPNVNYNGPDSFTYRASDGLTNSNTATVSITVNPVNDPPVANNESYSVNGDLTLTIGAPGVLSNDTDVDGPALSAVLNSNPPNGTLLLNANGSFSYTPNTGYAGSDSFTYHANDGSLNSNVATVSITITAPSCVSPNLGSGWTSKASVSSARVGLAAAELNGLLYDVGGTFGSCDGQRTLESYDPATNTWTPRAPMPTGRYHPAAVSLGGKLYVLGGGVSCGIEFATVEAYDPSSNTWSTRASLPGAREGLMAAAVNGKIYAMGGHSPAGTLHNNVWEYDPVANSWTPRANMPVALLLSGTGVVNNLIYVVGGQDNLGIANATTYVFDPAANTWATKASMPTARTAPGAATLNGKVYVYGGNVAGVTSIVESYDPTTNLWSSAPSMITSRAEFGAAAVGGKLFAVSGFSVGFPGTANVEAFSPSAGMVAWYPANGNTNDVMGGNNGALQNGATYGLGKVGQAFSFDGVDDFVEV